MGNQRESLAGFRSDERKTALLGEEAEWRRRLVGREGSSSGEEPRGQGKDSGARDPGRTYGGH